MVRGGWVRADRLNVGVRLHKRAGLCRYSDKGYLDFRDHLPVRRVVIGDTNRTGSEAKFSVGPLRCHGDSNLHTFTVHWNAFLKRDGFKRGFVFSTGNIWNTIAFVKPTYITFPTFRPGSSADISFHFKTYRDHGVFLENSDDQLRNFIRIELNSEQKSSLLKASTFFCTVERNSILHINTVFIFSSSHP